RTLHFGRPLSLLRSKNSKISIHERPVKMTSTPNKALVTGGSRGLGKNMAQRLARHGHDVVVTYLSKEKVALALVAEIEGMGRKAAALRLDVGDIAGLDTFVDTFKRSLQDHWGVAQFDILVNNAGIGATIPFEAATEADFDRFMNIRFKGVYFLTQKTLPLLGDNARIINVSSGTTRFCIPGYSIYASMKTAIETVTRYLAKELGPRGITVNVVAPGAIETDFNNAAVRSNPELNAFIASQTALGRAGQADDIGGVVAFLASAEAHWITGQRIEVSGGMFL
ncbi:MAG: SDR family oxidoreductase, partial [Desulfosarcinaceae bacterium]